MPNSDSGSAEQDDEESDNSDDCEKGLGKRKLMSIVSKSKQKFKRTAVHQRGRLTRSSATAIEESSEEDESEEQIMS